MLENIDNLWDFGLLFAGEMDDVVGVCCDEAAE
jgi:hypothetical protein